MRRKRGGAFSIGLVNLDFATGMQLRAATEGGSRASPLWNPIAKVPAARARGMDFNREPIMTSAPFAYSLMTYRS